MFDVIPFGVLHLQQRLPALNGGIRHDDIDFAVIWPVRNT
jgi:hypothetical protein